ncbi:MAG: response regulator [Acetobacteraceae bacterium]|nr:response regulator [Acetobacteraceae bacterium]
MSYEPTGGPGIRHWQSATISEPGLDSRGNVFFAAIEMTRMPMILTDPNLPDNPIVFANRAFQDLTGYEMSEITGRNCRFLQGAETSRAAVQEMRAGIEQRRAVSAEILNYKRDGTPFWNGVYIAPVFDRDGALLYFFASQLDITRRRTAEQAFRQSQKMESIGQLTAGLAHDFNNLLQVILSNLDGARNPKVAPERLVRHLDSIGLAAERGAKLTRQLLAFARKTRLEPKPVDLNALLTDFADLLETTLGSRIELEVSLRRRIPPVNVDPVHLEMALLNILINARDATPDGGTVTVATSTAELQENGLPGGRYAVLSVTDTGHGMPPHVLERATEPFFTTKTTGKGTGLGLAMAHGFAQQSLGRLEIESEPDKGTTVRLLFPAMTTDAVFRSRQAPAPVATREDPRGGTETILLVDDSEDVLALAQEHLEALGYRILAARSGEEALELLAARGERGVDLLFTDIVMPGGVNGLMLAERVKARLPDLPVLLTTGYNEDLVADGPRAAAMDVLGKPYRRAELADRVRAALDRRGPRGNAGLRHDPASGPAHEA